MITVTDEELREIFAFNKEAPGGDLESLGCKGVNNYNDFWLAKDIYAE